MLKMLFWLGGILLVQSCADTPMPQQEINDVILETRGCDPDAQYQAGLKTFLADHYDVSETNVTLSYIGVNGNGEYVFPFSVSKPSEDIDGDYIVDDLCLAYDAEFIVEDDLIGI